MEQLLSIGLVERGMKVQEGDFIEVFNGVSLDMIKVSQWSKWGIEWNF